MKDSFIYGGTAAIMAGTIACIACASHFYRFFCFRVIQ